MLTDDPSEIRSTPVEWFHPNRIGSAPVKQAPHFIGQAFNWAPRCGIFDPDERDVCYATTSGVKEDTIIGVQMFKVHRFTEDGTLQLMFDDCKDPG